MKRRTKLLVACSGLDSGLALGGIIHGLSEVASRARGCRRLRDASPALRPIPQIRVARARITSKHTCKPAGLARPEWDAVNLLASVDSFPGRAVAATALQSRTTSSEIIVTRSGGGHVEPWRMTTGKAPRDSQMKPVQMNTATVSGARISAEPTEGGLSPSPPMGGPALQR
ncbi:hypothetical protein B0T26DRAFT_676926 [Lasiosphaeria miniovina]|uniref:Uncharacterized protein n=1 Tax=Lasiosphaeria miniovina TaxID=1954250 RepID=A0AA40AB96_9PEZI|nr:uncharacterized protein B0T26DRAFT_676926 [Lasiosphaeria miniovina]KAK0712468.1 hypothetical protein B0T26DRAFT_676926 [Lasiosphaeria miniovina]